jgi:hypothetical protein
MKILLVILCACFFCIGGDDPPKNKDKKKDSTVVQAEQNTLDLDALNRSLDSLRLKQDTLIKKK